MLAAATIFFLLSGPAPNLPIYFGSRKPKEIIFFHRLLFALQISGFWLGPHTKAQTKNFTILNESFQTAQLNCDRTEPNFDYE